MHFCHRSFLPVLALAFAVAGCSKGPSDPKDPNFIVASGKGFTVTRAQLDREIPKNPTTKESAASPHPDTAAIEKNALNRLIDLRLLETHLDQFKIKNLDSAVTEEYKKALERFPTPAEFQAYLQNQGKDEAAFREQIRRFVLLRMVRQSMESQPPAPIKEEEIQTEYQKNAAAWQRPEVLRVNRVIFRVTREEGAERMVAIRKAAQQFRQKLAAGATFTKTASTLKPSDFPKGLVLGPDSWTASSISPGLAAAAFKLSPGAVGEIAEIPEGVVVYQIIAKIPARTIALAEAEKQIRSRLDAQARSHQWQETLQTLRQEVGVQIYLK